MAFKLFKVPFHLDVMERIESMRFGLWFLLIQRGQGHLAHHVLGDGFLLLEFMRCLPCPLGGLNSEEFRKWNDAKAPFVKALLDTKFFLANMGGSVPQGEKIGRLAVDLGQLGYAQGHRPADAYTPDRMRPLYPMTEEPPCDNVPSVDAPKSSAATCSAAEPTGTPSTENTDAASTPSTMPGVPEQSTPANSDRNKKQSSANMKKLRGTGHPKRGNPYTKERGKKR
jgi:hypothetical protein